MPADEVHHDSSAGEPRARTGPRHAAPRKPLLTRFHVPAGKAIALAAMPTAVLMGMGLTPTLAQARPGVPENPFQDGPCVTAPDKDAEAEEKAERDAEAAAEKKAREDAAKKDAERDTEKSGEKNDADQDAKDSDGPTAPSSPPAGNKPDPGDKADPDPTPSKPAPKPEPEPEPAKPRNPLDPLGLGDAIKDVFTPDEKESATPDPRPSAPQSTTSPKAPAKDTTDKVTEPVKDAVDKADQEDKADQDDKAERDDKPGQDDKTGQPADDAAGEGSDDTAETEDPMAPDENGKKPFPCVVEKKVDGKAEQAPAPIPNQPWHLEASSLTLKGADYQGVVNLTMPDGRTKQALKYVVQKTDIGDLHQIVEGPAGKKYHVEAAKGSTSTIRDGETTMYTERISGKLFGLIPITFDPEHPPPLNIPLIYFTDVTVQQAGQFGGNLTIPGLHQSITD
ncbi:hypothetical protein [Streptomyces huasconensis]|uniref:hypothetical protein n=1 Tax=Streptomyces huasconensis TaxID=1854574 RepID=UPI0036F9C051